MIDDDAQVQAAVWGMLDAVTDDLGRSVPAEWGRVLSTTPRHRFLPDTIWLADRDPYRPVSRADDQAAWFRAAYADAPVITQINDGAVRSTRTMCGRRRRPRSRRSWSACSWSSMLTLGSGSWRSGRGRAGTPRCWRNGWARRTSFRSSSTRRWPRGPETVCVLLASPPWSWWVWQHGARRLWDEVERAWAWFESNDRPSPSRFGLTVAADGTHAPWLDGPGQSWRI